MVSNKEMQDLIDSVMKPMLFYAPSEILTSSAYTFSDEMKNYPIFDLFLIADENGRVTPYEEGVHSMMIFRKEHVFNSNVFQLLEIKGRNNDDAFKYLIEKYMAQVRSYHDSYIWMYDSVDTFMKGASVNVKSNLKLQMTITMQHVADLESRFSGYDSIETESIDSILAKTSSIKDAGESQDTINNKSNDSAGKSHISKSKPTKRKKVVLATDKEVDEYLLKTIFNINTPKITTKKSK